MLIIDILLFLLRNTAQTYIPGVGELVYDIHFNYLGVNALLTPRANSLSREKKEVGEWRVKSIHRHERKIVSFKILKFRTS